MKIALIGYGRMGREIESVALERGHEVILKISEENLGEFIPENLQKADVAIEFTRPEAAVSNVGKCLKAGLRVVSGTTGWNKQIPEMSSLAADNNISFIHASNFSLGVNLFFVLNEYLAKLMDKFDLYDVSMKEIHHTRKLDAPSGTAITLAEGVLKNLKRKESWKLDNATNPAEMAIEAIREGDVPGTHLVQYSSENDDITIMHEAKNRHGFALGAVLAAEFIKGKTGTFTMRDVLQLNH